MYSDSVGAVLCAGYKKILSFLTPVSHSSYFMSPLSVTKLPPYWILAGNLLLLKRKIGNSSQEISQVHVVSPSPYSTPCLAFVPIFIFLHSCFGARCVLALGSSFYSCFTLLSTSPQTLAPSNISFFSPSPSLYLSISFLPCIAPWFQLQKIHFSLSFFLYLPQLLESIGTFGLYND